MEIQVLYWKCARLSELWWGLWTEFPKFFYTFIYGFQSLKEELGFRIQIVSGIPDSLICIWDSTDRWFQVPQAKFSRISDSTNKNFSDSGIRIPSDGSHLYIIILFRRKVWRHVAMVAKVLDDNNRELTITAKATRTGKKNWFIKQNNNFAHAMFIHFLTIIVRLRHETS